jgi:hypothetical protein
MIHQHRKPGKTQLLLNKNTLAHLSSNELGSVQGGTGSLTFTIILISLAACTDITKQFPGPPVPNDYYYGGGY